MGQIKSFLWFSAKVALALVVANVANALIAKFTGVNILEKIEGIAGQVSGS